MSDDIVIAIIIGVAIATDAEPNAKSNAEAAII